jgi:outer membrane protein TolC
VTPWSAKAWDLQTLSLASLYFNPALDLARARLAAAAAAVVTAGARPNPTFSVSPGVPYPYLLTLDFAIPIETAGKRGYRIQAARALDEAARLDLADTAWTVRSGVRLALLNYLVALRGLDLIRAEARLRQDQVAILEKILAAGEIPRSYGHRNEEGLTIDPTTGELWETEHGPRGGDELNSPRPARITAGRWAFGNPGPLGFAAPSEGCAGQ